MRVRKFVKALEVAEACESGIKFAAKFETFQAAWEACKEPGYMFWLMRKAGTLDRMLSVKLAAQFARLALPYAKSAKMEACIVAVEGWIEGRVSTEVVREHRQKCWKIAAYAADAAADARSKTKIIICKLIRLAVPKVPVI